MGVEQGEDAILSPAIGRAWEEAMCKRDMIGESAQRRRDAIRRLLRFTGLLAAVPAIAGRASADEALSEYPLDPSDGTPAGFMARARRMRDAAVAAGDQPYGAVIVRNSAIIGHAPSRVVERGDPTAHAEMEAIRHAALRLGTRNLSGCTMYSTSRPCPMCEAAAYWANIDAMYFGDGIKAAGTPRLERC